MIKRFLFFVIFIIFLFNFAFSYKIVRVVFKISSRYPGFVKLKITKVRTGNFMIINIYPNRLYSNPYRFVVGFYRIEAFYNKKLIGKRKVFISRASIIPIKVLPYIKESETEEKTDINSENSNLSNNSINYNNKSNFNIDFSKFPYKPGWVVVKFQTKPDNCNINLKLLKLLDRRVNLYNLKKTEGSFYSPNIKQIPKGDYYIVISKTGFKTISKPIRITENKILSFNLKAYVKIKLINKYKLKVFIDNKLISNNDTILEGKHTLSIYDENSPIFSKEININLNNSVIDVSKYIVKLNVENREKKKIKFINKKANFNLQVITQDYQSFIPIGKYIIKVYDNDNLIFKRKVNILNDFDFSLDNFFVKAEFKNFSPYKLKLINLNTKITKILSKNSIINLQKDLYLIKLIDSNNNIILTIKKNLDKNIIIDFSKYFVLVKVENNFKNLKIKLVSLDDKPKVYNLENNELKLLKGKYKIKFFYNSKFLFYKVLDLKEDSIIEVSDYIISLSIKNLKKDFYIKLVGLDKFNKDLHYDINSLSTNIIIPSGNYKLKIFKDKNLIFVKDITLSKKNKELDISNLLSLLKVKSYDNNKFKLFIITKGKKSIFVKNKEIYLPKGVYYLYVKDNFSNILERIYLNIDKDIINIDLAKLVNYKQVKKTNKNNEIIKNEKVDNSDKVENNLNKLHRNKKEVNNKFLIIGVFFVIVAIILIVLLVILNKSRFITAPLDKRKELFYNTDKSGVSFIGEVLKNKYEIVKKIASGGMGDIYLALHVKKDLKVAVKVLHRVFLEDEEFVKRFKREADIGKILYHPHIIRIYDNGFIQSIPYIIMEYVQGITLRKLLKDKGKIKALESVKIIMQIAEALDYAHQKGVIHRDLKPENVMLVNEKEVKVADFGIAKINSSNITTNLTAKGSYIGTPVYMSPEQLLGKDIDARSDIYSLGIIFYELIKGEPPFKGPNAFSIINAHLSSPVPKLRNIKSNIKVDLELERIILKMLEKDRDKRFNSAEELLNVLRQYLNKII